MAAQTKWFTRLPRAAASLLALAVIGPAQTASAQDSVAQAKLTQTATATDDEAKNKTIIATFPDLEAKATVQRLSEFQKDPAQAKALKTVSDLLSKSGVKSSDLDTVLLPLIEGREIADVDVSLAAIMRQHYLEHLKNDTSTAEALSKTLENRDSTLSEAAYGATPRRIVRYRSVRTRR